jgi:hypothetical protein
VSQIVSIRDGFQECPKPPLVEKHSEGVICGDQPIRVRSALGQFRSRPNGAGTEPQDRQDFTQATLECHLILGEEIEPEILFAANPSRIGRLSSSLISIGPSSSMILDLRSLNTTGRIVTM